MRTILFIAIPFLILACGGEKKLTDQELIEKNVRNYFFMGDSVQLEVTITDTINTVLLDEMMATTSENIRLVQLDIDTLGMMIDDWSYKILDLKKTSDSLAAKNAEIKLLEYRLKRTELEYKQAAFKQSNRIFMHLQRSIWADIAGFEAKVHYTLGEETNDLVVLMDANFNVVD